MSRTNDLADMLEEQYKNKHVQCNMNIATCGNRPCDLCRIEQFARDVRADAIDEVFGIVMDCECENNYKGWQMIQLQEILEKISKLKEQKNGENTL